LKWRIIIVIVIIIIILDTQNQPVSKELGTCNPVGRRNNQL
jgi:hypothetical protein